MKCPEITQKIMRLGESPLKIIELLIKFLLESKINTVLHGLSSALHVLTLSCSAVLDLFFYFYLFYLIYLMIGLEASFENQTIQFKYTRISLTWKKPTKQTNKTQQRNSFGSLPLEFITYLNENWFQCLFGQSKTFQKIKEISSGGGCCLGEGRWKVKYCKTALCW